MKFQLLLLAGLTGLVACKDKSSTIPLSPTELTNQSINGTWKLVSSKVTTGEKTEVTYPVKGQEMIKLFNGSHFAFFKHDLVKGATPTPVYDTGAGTYTLKGDQYQEHLDYCNYRDWENRDFKFTLTLKNDTITQKGIEKIDSLNINQEIVEIYTRIK
ncbi:hypothetical protein HDF26_000899 [Pedobacter cryoconitis]|uniref:Lipocalin-like domain-containing protein n=1 Tax=Pedobacter cryoconitis TaxID=188932 RepID=A0A7W8ZPE9_9SPHI|nr:lipocalin-like domain-containing protein [Pedobacter cryoconitis]MBB5637771.1 hypothetical protein [Pedobacter cryoconitis]MBB6270472.1 hypothetical protein [Pedobacter cryoconitis]